MTIHWKHLKANEEYNRVVSCTPVLTRGSYLDTSVDSISDWMLESANRVETWPPSDQWPIVILCYRPQETPGNRNDKWGDGLPSHLAFLLRDDWLTLSVSQFGHLSSIYILFYIRHLHSFFIPSLFFILFVRINNATMVFMLALIVMLYNGDIYNCFLYLYITFEKMKVHYYKLIRWMWNEMSRKLKKKKCVERQLLLVSRFKEK